MNKQKRMKCVISEMGPPVYVPDEPAKDGDLIYCPFCGASNVKTKGGLIYCEHCEKMVRVDVIMDSRFRAVFNIL